MYYIPTAAIRHAQSSLGFAEDQVDGELGPDTESALDEALAQRRDDLHLDHRQGILQGGSRRRKISAYIQLLCTDEDIAAGIVDGYWGPQTDFAFSQLSYLELHGELPDPFRDVEPIDANPHGWPPEFPAALVDFYGEPGDESNLVSVPTPWTFKLSWNLRARRTSLRLHRKVADSAIRVLERTLDHYGMEEIERLRLNLFAGDYSDRTKRGGTEKSTHAWGIAIDFDSENNKLHWNRSQASFAHPDYDPWWRFWEEEGWTSLGRTKNFDWMHVQAAKIP